MHLARKRNKPRTAISLAVEAADMLRAIASHKNITLTEAASLAAYVLGAQEGIVHHGEELSQAVERIYGDDN